METLDLVSVLRTSSGLCRNEHAEQTAFDFFLFDGFCGSVGLWFAIRASTIKGCLVDIRFFHLAHGYENPLDKLPRVWQAYLAAKRQQGSTVRKHPITREMCDWLAAHHQAALGLVGIIKRAARYLAIYLGCRCSEYLGPEVHWEKVILVSCVRPMREGQ